MSEAFSRYQESLQNFSKKVNQVSEEINDNRAAHAAAVQKFELAYLADDAEESAKWEKEIAGINAAHEILTHRANALAKASGRGGNATVRDAAKKVLEENKAEIDALRKQWDVKKAELLALQKRYLEILVALGEMARESSFLREQCTLAAADARSNVFVQSLGDELDISRRRGFLWLDDKAIRLAYTSSELPRDESFQGIYTGTPREKIRADQQEQVEAE